MYSIDSYESHKNEGFLLVEDKNHIWFLAKVVDNQFEIVKDGLLYATNKYVVIDYNGAKIISLDTKSIICSGDNLVKIINDLAIFSDNKIYDLQKKRS